MTATLDITVFRQELKTLRVSIREIEDVRGKSLVGVDTRDVVVENSVVRAALLLENLIEELFVQSLLGLIASAKPVIAAGSRQEVGLLLNSSARQEAYLTWLPYKEYTIARALLYLEGGGPFPRIMYRPVEMRALRQLSVLRNAVAHDSEDARAKFFDMAREAKYQCVRPADYLLKERDGAPEVLHLLARIERIGLGLVAATDSEADELLEPESTFSATQKVPPGTYRCSQCEFERVVQHARTIGGCPQCGTSTTCPHCGQRSSRTTAWIRSLK